MTYLLTYWSARHRVVVGIARLEIRAETINHCQRGNPEHGAVPGARRIMAVLAFVLMFAGFVTVAASMSRHRQQLGSEQRSPTQLLRWRVAGYLLLAISLVPCLLSWTPSIALALWCGLLTPAAVALGLLLTYAPGWTRRVFKATQSA